MLAKRNKENCVIWKVPNGRCKYSEYTQKHVKMVYPIFQNIDTNHISVKCIVSILYNKLDLNTC